MNSSSGTRGVCTVGNLGGGMALQNCDAILKHGGWSLYPWHRLVIGCGLYPGRSVQFSQRQFLELWPFYSQRSWQPEEQGPWSQRGCEYPINHCISLEGSVLLHEGFAMSFWARLALQSGAQKAGVLSKTLEDIEELIRDQEDSSLNPGKIMSRRARWGLARMSREGCITGKANQTCRLFKQRTEELVFPVIQDFTVLELVFTNSSIGHLMWGVDSLEKTLKVGKIEGRRKGQKRMRWLDGFTDSMDMSLSKLQRWWRTKVWCAAVREIPKSQTPVSDWTRAATRLYHC